MVADDTVFRLEFVSLSDIPHITELWYAAFRTPETRRLFPDTPGLRQWWSRANRYDLLHKPAQRYLKVVNNAGKVIAYAKWDLAAHERGGRFPPWHGDSDQLACEVFYGTLDRERMRLMAGRYYYLDMLVTHPDYRRRGAASMLVRWGCELADRHGARVHVDASPEGAALYRKFGFENRSNARVRRIGAIPMVRELRAS